MFKVKKINDKDVYYSDLIETEHFFTSRDIEVKENIDVICNYLKIEQKKLIHPTQIHSDNIEVVKENKNEYLNCDGLIINKKNIAIYLNFADCTPIILYDFKKKIASIVHAGWRGTALKIGQKAVLKMKEIYLSNPKDIIGVIGPCISFNEFETSDEIIEKLSGTIKNKDELFDKSHADLKGINAQQLREIGVENIDICPYCTVLDNDKFFSYRKENQTTKRHSAVLKLS